MAAPPDLSIIFGTYNRRASLERCLRSIRDTLDAGRMRYEVIVTDGGSTDGSDGVLRAHGVEVVRERERRGAVAAFNAAYALSRGRHIAALNDDVEIVGTCLAEAVVVLDNDAMIGQVALGYRYAKQHAGVPPRVYNVLGHTYANLGVIRREVAEQCASIQGGLWNPRYHTYAADTELSCWVWKLGHRVHGFEHLCAIDYEIRDGLRRENNSGRNVEDAKAFGRRWPTRRHIEHGGLDPVVDEDELTRYYIALED